MTDPAGAEQLPPPLVIESTAPDSASTHVVTEGDNFWRIAEDTVAIRSPDESVAHYWMRLMEANRSRLVDPTNPSLLHVGQIIVLP